MTKTKTVTRSNSHIGTITAITACHLGGFRDRRNRVPTTELWRVECWADVFWWLCAPSLGDRRQDLKAFTSSVHYPTFRSNRVVRGSTFDPSNPSLLWPAKKIGLGSSVRVQNHICLRHKFEHEICWDDEIPSWTHIDHEFPAFNRWLNSFSRILILVGESNCRPESIRNLIPLEPGEEFVKVLLQVNCHMYGEIPYCMTVQSSESREIRQLILLSYHSHAWLGNHLRVIPALHDCLYNAAYEMAQIWYEDGVLFSGEAFRVSAAESKRKKSRRFTLATIVSLERKTGIKVSEHHLRENFSRFISKNPLLFLSGMPPP
ncbi:hypothetical protein F5B21DRAFT_523798 [Xylaria acuta]|nr:hypothetical protein F5B21DRAFT_523798 [Xylaria acuta]